MGRGWTRFGAALAALLAPALPAPAEERVWLGVAAPSEGARLAESIPFVEVSGWAGARQGGRHDVLLVLDVSPSTLAPSGSDVNGDGRVGRQGCLLPWWLGPWYEGPGFGRTCPDAGDTVRAAERSAAEHLLEQLDWQRTRMGLVTFHGGAELVTPLGARQAELRTALRAIEMEPGIAGNGTDFRAAIETALEAFADAPLRTDWDGAIQRSLLFLSDGTPTLPGFGGRPARKALEAAAHARRDGVRIHAFALGPEVQAHAGIYRELARRTGGHLTRVARPAEIVAWLPRVNLADVADISMANLTSGRSGRAIRTFADGSFEGYVPLVRGANRLRVTARGSRGHERSVERSVHFEPPAAASTREKEQRQEEQQRFARALAERTAETEALHALERARQRKQLEVRVLDEQRKHLELAPEAPGSPAPQAPRPPVSERSLE